MLKYSPKPLQTPAISEFLCLYNFFIINKKRWSEVDGFDLRVHFRLPLQTVTPT